MKNKIIGILFCMLLIYTVLPSSANVIVYKTYNSTIFSNNFYVGGGGPNNYTKIQDAIDDAVDGDTVFIYDDSSPYFENIIVDKSITLIGENMETTVIDGNHTNESVVVISADMVDFSDLTVQNSNHLGLKVTSSQNYIHDCKIRFHNWRGMQLQSGNPPAQQNTIAYNIFENNDWGLIIYDNIKCSIIGNYAINNKGVGICIVSTFCTIKDNIMVNNGCGLWIADNFNKINKNEIRGNKDWGIFVSYGNFNQITHNNFIDNGFEDGDDSYYTHASYHFCLWQYWSRNFWNPRKNITSDSSTPYLIFRERAERTPLLFNIDWNPAQEPIDI